MISAADSEILATARERFALAEAAELTIRAEARKDLKYLAGEQWDPDEQAERRDDGRPALVINKLPQFVDQVVNDQRKNRPGAKVSPIDGGADADTADVIKGLIRDIEHQSHAEVAYDTGFEYSASCSFGYWRYLTQYVDDDESFDDQEIRVVTVMDPFAVYIDPGAQQPDKSDMRWAFVIENITKEDFKRRFPKSETTSADFWALGATSTPLWLTGDGVRLAEYWLIKTTKRKWCKYSNGKSGWKDEVPKGLTCTKERERDFDEVKQYVINGAEILERAEWKGKYIPIVKVSGKQMVVDGETKIFSLIRFARDPQALYNYFKTAMAETVGIAPKSPWLGWVGQFKTDMAKWAHAHKKIFPFLQVDTVQVGGQLAPLPTRTNYEPPVQALSLGALQASDDIKATTGLFDPSLGAAKASMSGRAIDSQKAEGDNSNFHLIDNLTRSLWHGYRILVDLIPHVYDGPRVIRIVKPDHESELVTINQEFEHPETGKPTMHDFSVGRYGVAVSVGPSAETRREETREHLEALAQADPASLPQWADLYVKSLDIGPIGDQIAERLTPAQFRDKGDPRAMQATLQQLSASHDQMVQQLHQASQVIETKQAEQQARIEIAKMQEATKLQISQSEQAAADRRADLDRAAKLAIAEIETKAQDVARIGADRFAAEQAGLDRAHDAALETTAHSVGAAKQLAAQEHAQGLQAGAQDAAAAQAEQQTEPGE